MITELNHSDFYRCKTLLNDHGQLEAKAVVEKVNPGRIFVDDIEKPTSGIIWLGNNDGFIFIGNEGNKEFNSNLNQFIDTVIIPEARKVSLDWFEAIGNHNKWDETIKRVFENRNIGSWNQRVYLLQKQDYRGNYILPIEHGYSAVKINEMLYNNYDHTIINIEFLHSKILEFWSSPDKFFSEGIGYCIVYQNEIVSICFSGFVVDKFHCIDIETLEKHRGKKLAQRVAVTFVEECMDKHLVSYWDCMESNKPSMAVAENIGFKNVFNYKGYEFKLG